MHAPFVAGNFRFSNKSVLRRSVVASVIDEAGVLLKPPRRVEVFGLYHSSSENRMNAHATHTDAADRAAAPAHDRFGQRGRSGGAGGDFANDAAA